MKSVQISHIVRLLALSACVFLLPSCKLITSVVKLPVNVLKSTAKMVGVSNLTDHPAQPVSKDSNTGAEAKEIDSESASRKLD
ncbi:MAG: hypothetical protein P8P36_05115 [Akkermansiaceae bacterium]|nr:hypothetical protein [Akkermansiaceae bacterium]